jgi:hypothetical protein
MTEPVNNRTLGGLTYNANQAKGKKVGEGKYELIFKTGERLYYPEQNTGGKPANVTQAIGKGFIYDDINYDISNVMGATFKSSKNNVSHVTLLNCKDTTVDLAANESRHYGDTARIYAKDDGGNNKVILDEKDHATIAKTNLDSKNRAYVEKEIPISGQGTANVNDYL